MNTIHNKAYQALINSLRLARRRKKFTQVELAHALRKDQSYVSKYERSERRLDVIEVRTICKALGISFADFVRSFERELKRKGLS